MWQTCQVRVAIDTHLAWKGLVKGVDVCGAYHDNGKMTGCATSEPFQVMF